jgi:hypothetical protein
MKLGHIVKVGWVWVMLFSVSPTLFSQTSDSIVEKPAGLVSRMISLAEKGMDYLTFKKGRHSVVVLPVAGYSPVAGVEMGLMPIWRIEPSERKGTLYYRPTTVSPSFIASTTGMFEVEIDVETFTRHLWTAKFKSQFVYIPDRFFPVGNKQPSVEPVKYKAYRYRVEGHLMKGVGERYFYGVEMDAGLYEHHPRESMMIPGNVTGANGGWCNALGPMFAYDTRDNSTWPQHGAYLKLSSLFAGAVLGSEYAYRQVSFDGRWFFKPFKSDPGVLASQFFTEAGSGDIPFYKLPAIGGKYALRGISHPLKYSNRHAWFVQTEFRRHLWWRFGGVAFSGVGSSFHVAGDAFQSLFYNVGAGLRIQVLPGENLHLRVDYGIANGGDHGLYLTLREAF